MPLADFPGRFDPPPRDIIGRLLIDAAAHPPEVSRRLHWFRCYLAGASATDVSRQFGISRSTFHRWMERFNPEDLSTLADRSHEPLSLRQSAIDPATVELIRRYRMRYPQMGKARIAELLQRDHRTVISASSVGRIIERECLYFADTPLHWKKRMEHQRAQGGAAPMVDSMQQAETPAIPVLAETPSQHITILADESDEEQRVIPRFTWQGMKRCIIVSSVITNVAFAAILFGMALFERVTEIPVPNPRLDLEQQEVLHAAPSPHVSVP